MSRLLEFQASEEEAVVSRILVQVHKAVDEDFPDAAPPSRRFAKTVFTDTDHGETTQNKPLPTEGLPPPPPPVERMSPPPPPLAGTTPVTKEQLPITAPKRKISRERQAPPELPPVPASYEHMTGESPGVSSLSSASAEAVTAKTPKSAARAPKPKGKATSRARLGLLLLVLAVLVAVYLAIEYGLPGKLPFTLPW